MADVPARADRPQRDHVVVLAEVRRYRAQCADLAAESNLDGRLELFGIDSVSGRVVHRWQTSAGGAWSDWVVFDQTNWDQTNVAARFISIAVARQADGYLQIFAVDGTSGTVYRRRQYSSGIPSQTQWTSWYPFGGTPRLGATESNVPPRLNTLVAKTNGAGRIELFATTVACEVLRRQEGPAANEWSDWAYLAAPDPETTSVANNVTALAAVRDGNGRIQLFGLNRGQVQLRYQFTAGGTFTDWSPFGPTPAGLVDLDAQVNAYGLVTLFGVDATGAVYQRTGGYTISDWSPWTALGTIGSTTAVVPDVRGMTVTQAKQTLQANAAAFTSQLSYFVDLTCNSIGTVASQYPAAGTTAAIETVVKLSVGTMPSPPYSCA